MGRLGTVVSFCPAPGAIPGTNYRVLKASSFASEAASPEGIQIDAGVNIRDQVLVLANHQERATQRAGLRPVGAPGVEPHLVSNGGPVPSAGSAGRRRNPARPRRPDDPRTVASTYARVTGVGRVSPGGPMELGSTTKGKV